MLSLYCGISQHQTVKAAGEDEGLTSLRQELLRKCPLPPIEGPGKVPIVSPGTMLFVAGISPSSSLSWDSSFATKHNAHLASRNIFSGGLALVESDLLSFLPV